LKKLIDYVFEVLVVEKVKKKKFFVPFWLWACVRSQSASRRRAAKAEGLAHSPRRFAKFDRHRSSRSVWTSAFATLRRDVAVTSAPLFVRMGNIHHSSLSARPTAPLKPAHSKRFAQFVSPKQTPRVLRRPSAAFPRSPSSCAWL
jgi:hypothetical protein